MKLQRDEVSLHYEGLRLRQWIVWAGWPLALAVALTGAGLVGVLRNPLADVVGLLLAVVGGLAIAGLARCRSFEIVIGTRLVTTIAGPLQRRVPVGVLEHRELRPASSWRRLYADRELVLDLPAHGETFILPSAEPEALLEALLQAKASVRTRPSS